jgi:hypothetical protein
VGVIGAPVQAVGVEVRRKRLRPFHHRPAGVRGEESHLLLLPFVEYGEIVFGQPQDRTVLAADANVDFDQTRGSADGGLGRRLCHQSSRGGDGQEYAHSAVDCSRLRWR